MERGEDLMEGCLRTSFQTHLPGVLNSRPKSLFVWGGEARDMGVWHSSGPGFLSGGESWAAQGWEEAAGRERPGEGRGRWGSLVAPRPRRYS